MESIAFVLAISSMATLSIFVGALGRKNNRTLTGYFWADKKLGEGFGTQLLLSASFSLNGLLYHAWLGYLVGAWSLAIQGVWVAGFFFLARYSARLAPLCAQDTLHGNIHRGFGRRAGRIAAIATIVGFFGLAGWELMVASAIVESAVNLDPNSTTIVALTVALFAVVYTFMGGLSGNAYANAVQNGVKAIAVLILVFLSFQFMVNVDSSATSESLGDRLKLDSLPFAALGGAAILSNLMFSFLWQSVDMTTWQAISATSETSDSPKSLLKKSAWQILLAPGLVGTLIGIGLQGVSGVDENNVLSAAITLAAGQPVLLYFIYMGVVAAMLATIDGYLLASSQAFVWDYSSRDDVRNLLSEQSSRHSDPSDPKQDVPQPSVRDQILISRAKFFMVAFASLAAIIFVAIRSGGISLFDLVYVAVVGQMSLVPVVVSILWGRRLDGPITNRSGECSIVAGLVGGFACIASRFSGLEISEMLFGAAPVVAIFCATVGIWAGRSLQVPDPK